MIKQQINFYQEEYYKSSGPLSFTMALSIIGGVLGVLIFAGTVQTWRVNTLDKEKDRLMAIHQDSALKLEEFTRKYPKISLDLGLQALIEERRLERKAKRQLVSYLSQNSSKNTKGFHAYLDALANQKVDGLWLKQIMLSHSGSHITLAGSTYKPELLPQYIAKLGQEAAFIGSTFANMQLTRPLPDDESPVDHLDFVLQSEVDE